MKNSPIEITKIEVEFNELRYEIKNNEEEEEKKGTTKLSGDKWNIMLLLFLYLLQGIPLGLAGSIPLILQQKKISYKEQSLFSLISWPFSLKLLWAPIVDSIHWSRLGRRKSWLIPVQYAIGLTLIILSNNILTLLGENNSEPELFTLFLAFVFLYFLAATQDIAVDGWGLSILSKKNVGHVSTCNTIGQTAGVFIGKVLLLALDSKDFCNTYLRSKPEEHGIVALSSFLKFWGYVFCVTTSGILIFKKEEKKEQENFLGLKKTYEVLCHILCLPSIRMVISICMTSSVGFTLIDYAIDLKLVESGLPKEHLALLDVPTLPITILIPFLIRKHVTGVQPLNVILKLYPYKLSFGVIYAMLLWWTRLVKDEFGRFPFYYYLILVIISLAHKVCNIAMRIAYVAFNAKISDPSVGGTYLTLLNSVLNIGRHWPTASLLMLMESFTYTDCYISYNLNCNTKETIEAVQMALFVTVIAFHAKISDPFIGGTYMTLLNTLSNFGSKWPSVFMLWWMDSLTYKHCENFDNLSCGTTELIKKCVQAGGRCVTVIDGYYILTIFCVTFGCIWLKWAKPVVVRVQRLPLSVWKY